jgi:hypothetical protein
MRTPWKKSKLLLPPIMKGMPMDRRQFLKSGLSLSAAWLVSRNPMALAVLQDNNSTACTYSPGQTIAADAFVVDKNLKPHTLLELCQKIADAKVNVLYIYGGGAHTRENRLGGIWCPDSFEDLHIIRYIHQKFDDSQVQIIPVACPPIYSSQHYGFAQRVFLDEPDDSPKFNESVKQFMESTEKVVAAKYLPVETYYDLRFRLLFNPREDLKPGAGYGTIHPWQGCFRASGETQKYGTPTIWLLNAKGVVLHEPFGGNIYHAEPFAIRYTILDLDKAIQRHVQ